MTKDLKPGDMVAITIPIAPADHERSAYSLAVVQGVDEKCVGLSVVVSRELLEQWDVKHIRDWGE